ncbi:MAG: oxygen-independent coproporphyrinogen III oxidase [Planctomycetes bacterium]|nr:oxygen-independent coproporphyrinogen III oxidase [Planctomycetota bacterium]
MIELKAEVDIEVFRRYAGLSLPRHVSYPMPTWWHKLDATDVDALIHDCRHADSPNALSLYLHIPFCEHLCKFCACTKVILRKSAPHAGSHVATYNDAIVTEIERLAEKVGADRPLRQIHWGGGTPTYLADEQIERIQRTIERSFRIEQGAEVAMEIDPRTVSPAKLKHLKDLGFNRVSFGVQDFNEQVQTHVRRVQPFDMVRDTVQACREIGFASVNFDLIYGLPYQTVETIRDTIERSISLSPDRVAYYHYAQIPEKIATQRGIDHTKLPNSETKLEMFLTAKTLFEEAGYEFIGLDHFAKPSEMLGQAVEDGTIQRNFQGMTTGGGLDLIGAGASSISHLSGLGFLQNRREVEDYIGCIQRGETAVHRGKRFTADDLVRQGVLNQLYCLGEIRPIDMETRFGIVFSDYFAREIAIMDELQDDGLVTLEDHGVIRATPNLGRVLLRNIAAVFDAYLNVEAYCVGEKDYFSANA